MLCILEDGVSTKRRRTDLKLSCILHTYIVHLPEKFVSDFSISFSFSQNFHASEEPSRLFPYNGIAMCVV